MINLSFSTLSLIYDHPHNYLNKMMDIKQPDNEFFKNGKRLHRIIQNHVSGRDKREDLNHIDLSFPIVETVDFDPKCKIEFKINNKYNMIGYFDGIDPESGRLLEIKTGQMWSIGKFEKSIQRRIYPIALPFIKENVLITAIANDSLWNITKPKKYSIPVKKEDRDIAMEWIMEGIKRLENIGYWKDKELEATGGVCSDPRCYWGDQCSFK